MEDPDDHLFALDPVAFVNYRNGNNSNLNSSTTSPLTGKLFKDDGFDPIGRSILTTPPAVRDAAFASTENFIFHVVDEAATAIQSIVRQRIATKKVKFKREMKEAKLFIQANLKHAYTFNNIRGANEVIEAYETTDIAEIPAINVDEYAINAIKTIQRAYRTYKTKRAIKFKKQVEHLVEYHQAARPRSREVFGVRLSYEDMKFCDFTLLDQKDQLMIEVRNYDQKKKKKFIQYKWYINSKLESRPWEIHKATTKVQKCIRGFLQRKHAFWKQIINDKKHFHGYLDAINVELLNDVIHEFVLEDAQYLHEKYVQSGHQLIEGIDVKTQEEVEFFNYAKEIVPSDSFVLKYIDESQKPPLTPRGIARLEYREKMKAKPYEPIERLLTYIDPDEKGWFDIKDIVRFALNQTEREEIRPLLSLLAVLTNKPMSYESRNLELLLKPKWYERVVRAISTTERNRVTHDEFIAFIQYGEICFDETRDRLRADYIRDKLLPADTASDIGPYGRLNRRLKRRRELEEARIRREYILRRRTEKRHAKLTMLPCDWRSVQEQLLPADFYRPPPKKKKKRKRRMMTWTELNARKMPSLKAREGASAKLMVMLQSWARRKYDVQALQFHLPKQMHSHTEKILLKRRVGHRLNPLSKKQQASFRKKKNFSNTKNKIMNNKHGSSITAYNPIKAGSAGELRSLAALEKTSHIEKQLNELNDSMISTINVLPEEDGIDTAREKIDYGKKVEKEKRIQVKNFKDGVLISEIIRNMESRESSLASTPGSPPSIGALQMFSPPHTAGSTSRRSIASSASPRTPLAKRFSSLQLSPKGFSPRVKKSFSPPTTAGSSSILSLSAFSKDNSTSIPLLQQYNKEDDEGVKMMWEEGRTLKTLQNVYGPSIQRAFVNRIIANGMVDNTQSTYIPVLSNGADVEQEYYDKYQKEEDHPIDKVLKLQTTPKNKTAKKKMKLLKKTTWQEMMYQTAWENGVKMNMHQAVSHSSVPFSNSIQMNDLNDMSIENKIRSARMEHETRMAKLKLKYGRLDDLPPMVSPRTMFKSTHIMHALKRNRSDEGLQRVKYAPYM
jgi:hypothetical protein